MNQKELESKKNRLFIIGSARGVNRFFITNKFIEKFKKASVINTGALISDLTKKLGFGSFDSLTFKEYFQIIEPIMIQSICDHLEHGDVILDTHFHYLIPAMALDSLFKLRSHVVEVILVLVEEDVLNIFKKNESSSNWWFKNIQNIEIDLKSNKHYISFYNSVFETFVKTKKLIVDLSKEEDLEQLNKILKEYDGT